MSKSKLFCTSNALIYEILMIFHSLKLMYMEYVLRGANICTLDVRTSFCLKFSVFRSMHKSHTSHLSHYETRKLLEIQNIVRPSINSFRKTFYIQFNIFALYGVTTFS